MDFPLALTLVLKMQEDESNDAPASGFRASRAGGGKAGEHDEIPVSGTFPVGGEAREASPRAESKTRVA